MRIALFLLTGDLCYSIITVDVRGGTRMRDSQKEPTKGPYGGYTTNVHSIPVGTKFFVCNGCWGGEIALVEGVKYMLGDVKIEMSKLAEDYTLDIEIK